MIIERDDPKYVRLTVTANGDVRLKVPKNHPQHDIDKFLLVADQIAEAGFDGTMRGKTTATTHPGVLRTITVYNDSKKIFRTYTVD